MIRSMNQLACLLVAFLGIPVAAVEEIGPGDTPDTDTARSLDELRAAYFAEKTGHDPATIHAGSIMLNLAGYATATGRSLHTVQAEFGYSAHDIVVPVGTLHCNVDAKGPHKGTVDLGSGIKRQWVKAKAYARCHLNFTGPAQPPPYLDWDLRMLLVRDPAWWKWWGAYKSYSKRGTMETNFTVIFRENQGRRGGTQVWFTYCENDDYENRVGVWADPPWPWVYLGVGPVGYEYRFGTVTLC